MNEDQKRVSHLREALGNKWPHPATMDSFTFLVSEVGEVGDALLRLGYGQTKGFMRSHHKDVNLPGELADAYLMLCTLATHLSIDLSKALEDRIKEIYARHSD